VQKTTNQGSDLPSSTLPGRPLKRKQLSSEVLLKKIGEGFLGAACSRKRSLEVALAFLEFPWNLLHRGRWRDFRVQSGGMKPFSSMIFGTVSASENGWLLLQGTHPSDLHAALQALCFLS